MSILVLGWELPPFNSGGLGVACYYLTTFLKKYIPDITFALPHKLPLQNLPFKVIFAEENSQTENISGYLPFRKNQALPEKLSNIIFSYGRKIYQQVKNNPPKLIHAHDWLTSPAGIYLKNKLRIPAVVHVHSTEFERTGGNPNQFIYDLEKDYFSRYDRVIAVSKLTRDILVNEYKLSENKVNVVTNGLVWEKPDSLKIKYFEYLKGKGEKIVLFVGRLVLQKGPDYLLKSAPLILSKEPRVTFCFVGDGDMLPHLVFLAHQFGINQKVIFTGFLREKFLAGIYEMSDLLVLPSVFDPFNLVALEGILHGIPVITSKTTGVSHYLDHLLKFDYWDTKEIANKTIAILRYDSLRNEYYQNQLKEARAKFDWHKSAFEVYKIYKEICPQL